METIPRIRVLLRECKESVTIRVEGLSFDVREEHLMERLGLFRRRRLTMRICGVVGVMFT